MSRMVPEHSGTLVPGRSGPFRAAYRSSEFFAKNVHYPASNLCRSSHARNCVFTFQTFQEFCGFTFQTFPKSSAAVWASPKVPRHWSVTFQKFYAQPLPPMLSKSHVRRPQKFCDILKKGQQTSKVLRHPKKRSTELKSSAAS